MPSFQRRTTKQICKLLERAQDVQFFIDDEWVSVFRLCELVGDYKHKKDGKIRITASDGQVEECISESSVDFSHESKCIYVTGRTRGNGTHGVVKEMHGFYFNERTQSVERIERDLVKKSIRYGRPEDARHEADIYSRLRDDPESGLYIDTVKYPSNSSKLTPHLMENGNAYRELGEKWHLIVDDAGDNLHGSKENVWKRQTSGKVSDFLEDLIYDALFKLYDMHERCRLIHRDIKPGNVASKIKEEGYQRKESFSVVNWVDYGEAVDVPSSNFKIPVGTLYFLPPELAITYRRQRSGAKNCVYRYGKDTDAYSFGAMIFDLFGLLDLDFNDRPIQSACPFKESKYLSEGVRGSLEIRIAKWMSQVNDARRLPVDLAFSILTASRRREGLLVSELEPVTGNKVLSESILAFFQQKPDDEIAAFIESYNALKHAGIIIDDAMLSHLLRPDVAATLQAMKRDILGVSDYRDSNTSMYRQSGGYVKKFQAQARLYLGSLNKNGTSPCSLDNLRKLARIFDPGVMHDVDYGRIGEALSEPDVTGVVDNFFSRSASITLKTECIDQDSKLTQCYVDALKRKHLFYVFGEASFDALADIYRRHSHPESFLRLLEAYQRVCVFGEFSQESAEKLLAHLKLIEDGSKLEELCEKVGVLVPSAQALVEFNDYTRTEHWQKATKDGPREGAASAFSKTASEVLQTVMVYDAESAHEGCDEERKKQCACELIHKAKGMGDHIQSLDKREMHHTRVVASIVLGLVFNLLAIGFGIVQNLMRAPGSKPVFLFMQQANAGRKGDKFRHLFMEHTAEHIREEVVLSG